VLESPREVVAEPPPTPPAQVVVAPAPSKNNLGPVAYMTTAVAIASVIAGIVFLTLGFVDRGKYFGSQELMPGTASKYTDAELSGLSSQSNIFTGLGTGLLGLAGALGITSAILFTRE
jgi:hypothetical protein